MTEHNCKALLAAVERLVAEKNDLSPNALRARAQEIEAQGIGSCPFCTAELRNRRPGAAAAARATEAARLSAERQQQHQAQEPLTGEPMPPQYLPWGEQRLESLPVTRKATQQPAITEEATFNPQPGEAAVIKRTEPEETQEWLHGGRVFPTLGR
jgi:hypothetical protein